MRIYCLIFGHKWNLAAAPLWEPPECTRCDEPMWVEA